MPAEALNNARRELVKVFSFLIPTLPLLYLSLRTVCLRGAHQISTLDLIMLGVSTTPAAISHTR